MATEQPDQPPAPEPLPSRPDTAAFFDQLPSLLPPVPPAAPPFERPKREPTPEAAAAPKVSASSEPVEVSAEADSLDPLDNLPRSRPIEPALVYLILVAVTILGLGGLAPTVRYTALWTVLIGVAILALLFDNLEVEIPTAPDMAWGIGYGAILGLPLLIIALPQLQHTSLLLFERSSDTLAFQSLAIMMPTAETLFFRGALQPTRGLLFTAMAGSVWSMLLFFPQLHVIEAPLVAIVIGFAFVVLNFLYSYIKRRFGLFASWTCQITINVLLLFVCRFL